MNVPLQSVFYSQSGEYYDEVSVSLPDCNEADVQPQGTKDDRRLLLGSPWRYSYCDEINIGMGDQAVRS